jgi:coenzyme F420 hydrogenase subunit delta
MGFSKIVIVGCGNPILADHGFGPFVIDEMKKLTIPDNISLIDAGLGAPQIFKQLDPKVTKKIIIIDIADFGAEPGTITKLRVGNLPPNAENRDIFSQFDVTIIACQPRIVTAPPQFKVRLSDKVQKAIPKTIQEILKLTGV